jgi:GTPase SAR1 family protein
MRNFDSALVSSNDLSDHEQLQNLMSIIEEYDGVPEIQWLKRQNVPLKSMVVFFLALRQYIFFRKSIKLDKVVKLLADSPYRRYELEKELKSGNHLLLKGNLLCFESDFFVSDGLKLTRSSLDAICTISPDMEKGQTKTFHPQLFKLISPDEIKGEQYIHDSNDLRLIEKMVSKEAYEKIRVKVPGLTILLTGAPGVGKTSFVFQLARNTGRPILIVNIAKILSSFVGQSEKNLVDLFDEAENAYQSFGDVLPICLFDEAESLLYTRNPNQTSSVDHMNNNMISLLLQCLDRFRGILFCCSNLSVRDFDPALARRFHQIVQVKAPSQEILKSIFLSRFPEFTDAQADSFLFHNPLVTPAEIERMRNKYQVQSILQEKLDAETLLWQIAEQEVASKNRSERVIGFKLGA